MISAGNGRRLDYIQATDLSDLRFDCHNDHPPGGLRKRRQILAVHLFEAQSGQLQEQSELGQGIHAYSGSDLELSIGAGNRQMRYQPLSHLVPEHTALLAGLCFLPSHKIAENTFAVGCLNQQPAAGAQGIRETQKYLEIIFYAEIAKNC